MHVYTPAMKQVLAGAECFLRSTCLALGTFIINGRRAESLSSLSRSIPSG